MNTYHNQYQIHVLLNQAVEYPKNMDVLVFFQVKEVVKTLHGFY